jgi:hypothetical protein
MATYTWTTTGISGDWATTGNWSIAGFPNGASDVAVFGDLAGFGYTVTLKPTDPSVTVSAMDVVTTSSALTINIGGSLTTDTLSYTGTKPVTLQVFAGGLFDINNAIPNPTVPETITVSGKSGGGHLVLGNLLVGADTNLTYTFSNGAAGAINSGIMEFKGTFTPGSTAGQNVTNIGTGDEFIVDNANFTGDTVNYSGTTLQVIAPDKSAVFTMSNVGLANSASTPSGFVIVGTNTIEAICYVRGTMIRTPAGELPVEKLRPGREVITLVDRQEVPRTVTWLGHRRIDLTAHPRPETVVPIRILRGAFAEAMPHRDLLVSPDHAIFVDGKLICARQLVNGTTIRQETGWTAVDYYHVELDRHAILLAEGLPAESYIDTGNSGFFANSGAPLVLHPDLTVESDYPTREAGSCAPFVSDEADVRPVWQRLADRAAALGRPVPQRATTTEAGLHLVAKGRTVKSIYHDARLVIFALPRHAGDVRLVSSAASPTDTRPWLEDRRRLGVRVARIVLRNADDVREVPVDHPGLAKGWWDIERDGLLMSRWTDGDAALPLPAMPGDVMLEVHLAGMMTYPVEATPEPLTGRRAA